MNLRLTKRGDYTVRAALALARAYPTSDYKKIRDVAAEMDLPLKYTPQILSLLAKADLAEARAGRNGGYRLRKDPAEISLLAVVEAAEGPLRTERCTLSGGPCRWEEMCAVHPAWEKATEAFRESLANVNLAQVLAVDVGLEAGDYTVPESAHRRSLATGRSPAKRSRAAKRSKRTY